MNSSQVIFPTSCCLCMDKIDNKIALCNACLADLPGLDNPCLGCAIPLPDPNSICGQCVIGTYAFDHTFSAFVYEHPVDWFVQQLKFGRKLYVADLMARLMAKTLSKRSTRIPQVLVPVPLDRWRMATRGFNQAFEIASVLSSCLSLPVNNRCFARTRHTAPQSGLTARARAQNLRGAFKKIRPCKHRHVAIIDDVMTTGCTAQTLARLLRSTGTEVVEVWTFARAV